MSNPARPRRPQSRRNFGLTLLPMLPALVVGCAPAASEPPLERHSFASQAECEAAYTEQVRQGLENPCVRERNAAGGGGFFFFGPWFFAGTNAAQYHGYRGGQINPGNTVTQNRPAALPPASRGTMMAPSAVRSAVQPSTSVMRGGFTSGRAGSGVGASS